MRKHKSQNGFTLAELLIVVAIIAILVAIAVPVFSTQLEKSREAVDAENARAANSIAMADYLINHSDVENINYVFALDKYNNLELVFCSETYNENPCTIPEHNRQFSTEYNFDYAKSEKCKDNECYCIAVTIENGKIVYNNFLEALA